MSIKYITDKTFEEITQHELDGSSYLNLFNILQDSDNNYFLNIFKSYVINSDLLMDIVYYSTYEVQDNDWLDSIAYNYYSNVQLWWLTLIANDIMNPFEDIEAGDTLKILKSNVIPIVQREIKDLMNK